MIGVEQTMYRHSNKVHSVRYDCPPEDKAETALKSVYVGRGAFPDGRIPESIHVSIVFGPIDSVPVTKDKTKS